MNKYKQVFIIVIVTVFVVPQIAMASWWNPFTWKSFSAKKIPTTQTQQVQLSSATTDITSTSTTNKVAITITKTPEKKSEFPKKPVVDLTQKPIQQKVEMPQRQQTTTQVATNESAQTTNVSPSVVAIDAFLADPTVEKFNEFCTISKTLPGTGERRVLNESRTDYVMKSNTLYDNVGECAMALGEYKKTNGQQLLISWFTYSTYDLFSLDNANESDSVRKVKINFNSYWNDISKYKLIGFAYTPENGVRTLNKIKESLAQSSVLFGTKLKFSLLFIVPEQLLSNIRTALVKK